MINLRFTAFKAIPVNEIRFRPTNSKRHNPFVYIALTAALLFSMAQVGCTGLTSANATDPATATTMAVSGASGSFGSVGTGASATQTFTVTNTGSKPLTITRIAVTGTGYTITGITLPLSVAAGKSTAIVARFAPTTAGALTGNISISANTNPSVTSIPLSGTGTTGGVPVISVQPTGIAYGGVGVGQNVGQLMWITNVGSGTLTISNISAVGPGFSVTGNTSPIALAAGQSTSFFANVNPTITGNIAGTVTVANNSSSSSIVIPLSATGMSQSQGQPAISVNPASFDFGNVAVGVSTSHAVTISNPGSAALSISSISASGPGFTVSGFALPISIAANQSMTMTATFVPASVGATAGSITIANNSATPNVVAVLNGTGTSTGQPIMSVNPSSVSFGNVTVGAPNSQTIVVQNNGAATLTISQATISGAGFTMSGLAAPATIAAGSNTTFNVAFGPSAAGAVSGSVSLVSNAPGSPTLIPLSGTGVTVTKSLSSSTSNVAFGNVAVGSNSSQNVAIINSGNSTVTIGSVNVTGAGYSSSGVVPGQTIGAGQTATLGVTFTPGSAATVSGNVTLTSDATNSPINISLSGTGTQAVAHSVSLTWTASTSTVIGYNVYRSTTSGGPYTLITNSPVTGTSFSDTTVQAGVTYFYVVTAVDASGNESVNSNEVSVTIPTP